MKVRLIRSFDFHAAHRLTTFPEGHRCRELHGHTFNCDVVLEGEVDEARGYLIDFGEVKERIKPVEQQLDHALLNDIEGLSTPTAEMLAKWIYDRLKPDLKELVMVRLYETPRNSVEYTGG